jgi:PKD repeat protein
MYIHWMPWFGPSNHMDVGYDSSDPAVTSRQVDDMLSRGIDGALVDWYGPNSTHHNTATMNLMKEAETRNGQFTFSVQEDVGALNACANTLGCDVTQRLIDDLNYAYNTFQGSPAYLFINGRPVVSFFGVDQYTIDWDRVRSDVLGNPLFIHRNSGGFSHLQSDGAFSWLNNSTDPMNMGLAYLDNFYTTSLTYPAAHPFGSAYKGFNDTLAAWGKNRIMSQQCGQTWLASFSEAGKYYSTSNQLESFQLVTWNDYEEGTEIETGIDNCVDVTGSANDTTLTWGISGQQSTIDHFEVFLSTDGDNLMSLGEQPANQRAFDISSLGLDPGTYSFFVKAIGQPSMLNKMSAAVPYRTNNQPPSVDLVVSPTSGTAPLAVTANATAIDPEGQLVGTQIDFGDGTVVKSASATHTYASAGQYTITATATDDMTAKGTATADVAVNAAPSVKLTVSPTSGTAPLAVTATSTASDSDGSITSNLIDFGDGTVLAGPSAQHTYAAAGTYTVKATVTDNQNASATTTATVNVTAAANVGCTVSTVNRTITICAPLANASVKSPVRVTAYATDSRIVTVMQIFVDGVQKYSRSYVKKVDTSLSMALGTRRLTVQAKDSLGAFKKTIYITVK